MITNILLIIDRLCLGVALAKLMKPRKDGFFLIDTSNPEKDVYTLELYTPFPELHNKKHITLAIKRYIPPSQD
jgi:hypothetical protein